MLSHINCSSFWWKQGSKEVTTAASDDPKPRNTAFIRERSKNWSGVHYNLKKNRDNNEHSETNPKSSSSSPESPSSSITPSRAPLSLVDIPFDVIAEIFRHLPVSTQIILSQTCRTFRLDLLQISATEILKLSKSQCIDVLVSVTGDLLDVRQCANCYKMIRDEKEPGKVPRCRHQFCLFKPFGIRDRMKDIFKTTSSPPYSISSVPYYSPNFLDSSTTFWRCCCSSTDQRIDASYRSIIYDVFCYEFCFRGCCCSEERQGLAFSYVRLVLENARCLQQKSMTENQKAVRKEVERDGSERIEDLYSRYDYHDPRLVKLAVIYRVDVPVIMKHSIILSNTKRDTFEHQPLGGIDFLSDYTIVHSIKTFTPNTSPVTSRNLPPFEVCRHLRYVPLAKESICARSFTYIVRFAISVENTRFSWGCEYCITDFLLFFSNGRLKCSSWQKVDFDGRETIMCDKWRRPRYHERCLSNGHAECDLSRFTCMAGKYDTLVMREEVN